MDIGKNIGQSFDYAKKLFDNLGQLLILIIISIIPIVDFIMLGYVMKVARETPESDHPPTLTNYGSLFVDGLKVVVVGIIYMIIPAILIGLSVIPFFIVTPSYFPIPLMYMTTFFVVIFAVLGLALAFFISMIFYMALVNMAKYGSISKAFAFSEILDIIKKVGWGSYILWIIVIFILMVIVGAIGSIPVVGWLISLIIAPAVATFAFRSAALVYSEGKTGAQPSAPSVAIQPPPPPPPPATEGQVAPQKTFCTKCGSENRLDDKYCQKCGNELAK